MNCTDNMKCTVGFDLFLRFNQAERHSAEAKRISDEYVAHMRACCISKSDAKPTYFPRYVGPMMAHAIAREVEDANKISALGYKMATGKDRIADTLLAGKVWLGHPNCDALVEAFQSCGLKADQVWVDESPTGEGTQE